MEKFPKINLGELAKEVELNRQQRREFAKQYVRWLKKTPNKIWSKQHAKFFGQAEFEEE